MADTSPAMVDTPEEVEMLYVLMRPQADAVIRTDGTSWQNVLRGKKVDEDILPFGGIVLDSVQVSSPTFREVKTQLVGYDAANKPITREMATVHELEVIDEIVGKGDKLWDEAAPPTVYVCRPNLPYAEYLASLREGWTIQMFREESHIPRKRKAARRAPAPLPAKDDEDTEEVEEDVTGAAPRIRKPRRSTDPEMNDLREQAYLIEKAGGPHWHRASGKRTLTTYIEEHGHLLADPAPDEDEGE